MSAEQFDWLPGFGTAQPSHGRRRRCGDRRRGARRDGCGTQAARRPADVTTKRWRLPIRSRAWSSATTTCGRMRPPPRSRPDSPSPRRAALGRTLVNFGRSDGYLAPWVGAATPPTALTSLPRRILRTPRRATTYVLVRARTSELHIYIQRATSSGGAMREPVKWRTNSTRTSVARENGGASRPEAGPGRPLRLPLDA